MPDLGRIWPVAVRVAGTTQRLMDPAEVTTRTVRCVREVSNPFDALAVAVYLVSEDGERQAGYLPKEIAAQIGDHLLPCEGRIVWAGGQYGMVGLRIEI